MLCGKAAEMHALGPHRTESRDHVTNFRKGLPPQLFSGSAAIDKNHLLLFYK